MGVDDPEAGPLADGADPAVPRAPVQSLAVAAVPDRPLGSLSESKVDRAGGSRYLGDHGRLVALPDDP